MVLKNNHYLKKERWQFQMMKTNTFGGTHLNLFFIFKYIIINSIYDLRVKVILLLI